MFGSSLARIFDAPRPRALWLLLNVSGASCLFVCRPALQVLPGLYFCLFGGGLLCLMAPLGRLRDSELAVLSAVLSVLGTTILGLAIDLGSVHGLITGSVYKSRIPSTALAILWVVLTLAHALRRPSQSAPHRAHGSSDWGRHEWLQIGWIAAVALLCVSGAILMRDYNSNLVLVTGYVGCALVVLVVAHTNSVHTGTLSLVVFTLGIALALSLPLRCFHLFGTDIHTEFWWFQTTFAGSYDVLRHADTPLSVCASISVLPSMLRSVTDIQPEVLMRFLYPCLFSLAPVALLTAWRAVFGASIGFLAAAYFISQEVFLDATCNPRTVTAVLFLAAFVLVMLSDRLERRARYFLLLACGTGCLVSHYSTSYVWLAILFAAVAWKFLLLVRIGSVRLGLTSVWRGVVSLPGVGLFSFGILLLYGYATGPALDAGIRRLRCVFTHLHELLDIEARGASFEGLMSVGSSMNSPSRNIELAVTWLCFALIGIGLLSTLARQVRTREEANNLPCSRYVDALALAAGAATVLLLSTVVPRVFAGYSMRRTYIVAMVVLSPFLVIGARVVGQRLRLPQDALGGIVVALYLLCTTSVLYQVWSVPKDAVLNTTGMEYNLYYVTDSESAACAWLAHASGGMPVVCDRMGGPRLMSQGHLDLGQVRSAEDADHPSLAAYLAYVRRGNLMTGTMTTKSRETLTLEQVAGENPGRVYASSEAEVMSVAPMRGAP